MGYIFFALKIVKLEEMKKVGCGKNLQGRKLSLVYLKSVGG